MTNTDDGATRRRFLRGLGGVAGLAALAGCPGGDRPSETEQPPEPDDEETATETETETATDADEVTNVVEAGASPDGDEPITPVLDQLVEPGATLYFPPGEYLMTQAWRVKTFEDLALVGEDATIRPEDGYDDYLFVLGADDGASGLRVENLEFDLTAPNTGARPLHGMVEDGLEVVDVRVRGHQDVDQDSMRFDVTGSDGTGVVRRLELPDGGDAEYAVTGCYVGEAHTGTIRFEDCHIAGFSDNGLYASSATGRVIVEGGTYANNDVSSVRVSGPAEVRNVTVRCDEAPEGFANMRGIRLREGRDVLVEDCTVEMEAVTGSDGAITMSNWLEHAEIRNTSVVVNADGVPGIVAKSPDETVAGDAEYQIRVEDVTVSGAATSSAAVRLLDREACLLDGVCVRQTGEARDGVHCTRVSDSTIRDSSIAVTGEPIVLNDATLTRQDIETTRLTTTTGPSVGSCE